MAGMGSRQRRRFYRDRPASETPVFLDSGAAIKDIAFGRTIHDNGFICSSSIQLGMKKVILSLCIVLVIFSMVPEGIFMVPQTTSCYAVPFSSRDDRCWRAKRGAVGGQIEERVFFIADTPLKTDDGKALFLGHRASLYKKLGLSFYIKSGGLVLGVKEDLTRYRPLPTGEELRLLQAKGELPDPLPKAKFSAMQRLRGRFGSVVMITCLVLCYVLGRRIRGQKEGNE
jgi:hypothetical protein